VDAGLRELDKRQGFRVLSEPLFQRCERLLTRRRPLTPLTHDEILEGVILSKDDSKKLYNVYVEDRKRHSSLLRNVLASTSNPPSAINQKE